MNRESIDRIMELLDQGKRVSPNLICEIDPNLRQELKDNPKLEQLVFRLLSYGHRQGKVLEAAKSSIRAEKKENAILKQRLETDKMTGFYNRQTFEQKLHEVINKSFGTGYNHVILTMIDLDKFKTINDSMGHLVGDQVLEKLGETARSYDTIRKLKRKGFNDTRGRYGGEEFVWLAEMVGEKTTRVNKIFYDRADSLRRLIERKVRCYPFMVDMIEEGRLDFIQTPAYVEGNDPENKRLLETAYHKIASQNSELLKRIEQTKGFSEYGKTARDALKGLMHRAQLLHSPSKPVSIRQANIVTASMGVAVYTSVQIKGITQEQITRVSSIAKELFAAADEALYKAKEDRNCVRLYNQII